MVIIQRISVGLDPRLSFAFAGFFFFFSCCTHFREDKIHYSHTI